MTIKFPTFKKAIFAGSFDPFHSGHANIIQKASTVFDQVWVVISLNPNKNPQTPLRERYEKIKKIFVNNPHVVVKMNDHLLTVEYARQNQIPFLVRGVRTKKDLEAEFRLANDNQVLAPEIQTVIFFADQKVKTISSSGIKEIEAFQKQKK